MANTSLLGSYGDNSGAGLMFRNRILNGAMVIDQRNAGAAVATGSTFVYPVDRFRVKNDVANGNTQRSTTAPTGFTHSLAFTTGTGGSPLAGNACTISQAVEGFNIADLAWGTASAQTVTASFWVRSSLTGTFAFRISNGVRSYVATYTINAANTFEYKTITIPGDTSGTWATDNSAGMYLNWDLGSGSSFNAASAGSWVVGDFLRVSGTASVIGTTGATFYITGVQLESGAVATPFERRPIGVELSLAQRYYYRLYSSTVYGPFCSGHCVSTTIANLLINFPVTMRTAAIAVESSAAATFQLSDGVSATVLNGSPNGVVSQITQNSAFLQATVASGLTTFRPIRLEGANTAVAFLGFSAEL